MNGDIMEGPLKRNHSFGDTGVGLWENLLDYIPQNLLRLLSSIFKGVIMKNSGSRVKFRNMYTQKKVNYLWVVTITIITFFVAIVLGYFSLVFMEKVSLVGAVIILFAIVFMGVFFDLLGIAVTAANETPFHSMASAKVHGSVESIKIIRNAGAVANFFNDVIGDIAGIISGSASAAIVVKLMETGDFNMTVASIVLTAIIAGITVGGKSVGKEIALRHANLIVFRLGNGIYQVSRVRTLFGTKR